MRSVLLDVTSVYDFSWQTSAVHDNHRSNGNLNTTVEVLRNQIELFKWNLSFLKNLTAADNHHLSEGADYEIFGIYSVLDPRRCSFCNSRQSIIIKFVNSFFVSFLSWLCVLCVSVPDCSCCGGRGKWGGREVKGPKVLAFTCEIVAIFSGFK